MLEKPGCTRLILTGMQQLCHPLGCPWSLRQSHARHSVRLLAGEAIDPPAAAVLGMCAGALPCPSLHMLPCSSKPPRASATSSLTGCHHTWPQLGDSLPDPSLVAPCPALLLDPSKAETPAAVPLALLRWKCSEWDGSWYCRGQGEGDIPGKGKTRGQLGSLQPSKVPPEDSCQP